MKRFWRRLPFQSVVALFAFILVFEASVSAQAQGVTDAQIRALQAQIDQLQSTIKNLEAAQTANNAAAAAAKKQASQAQAQAAQATAAAAHAQVIVSTIPLKSAEEDPWYLRHKPGNSLTFETPTGGFTAYGQLDVSVDASSKNVGPLQALNGYAPPVGNMGWMPDISTNLSYVGVRGFQRIPDQSFNFVYQLEGGFEISATPGTKESGSNDSNTVNGAFFNRNTFIGIDSPTWGAIKVGKEDGPYKTSTVAFNPFAGELGDYAVVMGNTGGDNRVEFGTRLDHAIWYESPRINGFQGNVLFAPGQNRSLISDSIASGESDCAGGNNPQSGGDNPVACNDGSFSDVVSANISYTNGGFYATAAGEWHHNVNRQSDITALYGGGGAPSTISPGTSGCSTLTASPLCQTLFNQDVGDEWASKIGALYKFSTGTTVGAIVEYMQRDVPADLQFQNERTRWGTWAFLSQEIDKRDSIHFGWAHAFHTPGDPCQHEDCTIPTADGVTFYAPNANQADMVTAAFKRKLSPSLTWYTDVAATINGPSAHYDLGAGGRAVTTDCHDAYSTDGGYYSVPRCFTGTILVGVSTGLQYRF